jgi:hypothetical protein
MICTRDDGRLLVAYILLHLPLLEIRRSNYEERTIRHRHIASLHVSAVLKAFHLAFCVVRN